MRGSVTLTFQPVAKPLDELQLDAVDLTVSAVTCSARLAGYQVTEKEIVVTFATPAPVGRETKLTIRYSAQPTEGLYFRTPSNGYPAGDAQVWSQGESMEHRHWFPCYDYPNAKFTSEVTCHVPEGMTVLSNGRQVSETKDPATGLVAVRVAAGETARELPDHAGGGLFLETGGQVSRRAAAVLHAAERRGGGGADVARRRNRQWRFSSGRSACSFRGCNTAKWWCGIFIGAAWRTRR